MSRQSAARTASSSAPGMTRSLQSLPQSLSRSLGARAATTLPGVLSIQRDSTQSATEQGAAASVRGVVSEPGRPLDAPTRSSMESHLGYDLSSVRVHTDERAAASAQAVNAGAYTAGSHIAFDTGRYSPGTLGGRNLMAHELTHVVQQAQGPVAGTPIGDGVQVSHPSDSFEREAWESGRAAGQHTAGEQQAPTQPLHAGRSEGVSVQRADPTADQIASQTSSASSSASAAKSAAQAGWVSGLATSIAGLGAIYTGVRSANFAGRSAEAAEDPPIQEPTTGGLAVTDADISPILGAPDEAAPPVPAPAPAAEDEAPAKKKGGKNATPAAKAPEPAPPPPPKPEKWRNTYHLLNINQGPANSADFFLHLGSDGYGISDGGTEPGIAVGYEGGTNNSNASVTFKARPAGTDGHGYAMMRLLIGGTNVPPRKTLQSSGWLGGGGPETNKNYKVQRFGGAILFSAKKGVQPVRDRMDVTGASAGAPEVKSDALVVVSLGSDTAVGAAQMQKPELEKAVPDVPRTVPAPADFRDTGKRYA